MIGVFDIGAIFNPAKARVFDLCEGSRASALTRVFNLSRRFLNLAGFEPSRGFLTLLGVLEFGEGSRL